MNRTQIYLAPEQDQALTARARRMGQTKSALIREAIDRYLAPRTAEQTGLARLSAAVDEASGVAGYLPSGEQYIDDLRAADVARTQELDSRRS